MREHTKRSEEALRYTAEVKINFHDVFIISTKTQFVKRVTVYDEFANFDSNESINRIESCCCVEFLFLGHLPYGLEWLFCLLIISTFSTERCDTESINRMNQNPSIIVPPAKKSSVESVEVTAKFGEKE